MKKIVLINTDLFCLVLFLKPVSEASWVQTVAAEVKCPVVHFPFWQELPADIEDIPEREIEWDDDR